MIHHILEVYRPHQTDQQKLANLKKRKRKRKVTCQVCWSIYRLPHGCIEWQDHYCKLRQHHHPRNQSDQQKLANLIKIIIIIIIIIIITGTCQVYWSIYRLPHGCIEWLDHYCKLRQHHHPRIILWCRNNCLNIILLV